MAADPLGTRSPERELLVGFLDWYRAVIERKLDRLPLDDARRVMTPTGLSPLGVVKHLGWVERAWFRWRFAGEDVPVLFTGGDRSDNSVQFHLEPGDTIESVLTFYRSEAEHARRVTRDAPSLDATSARDWGSYGRVSLRWILVHVLEETARHAGHLDLMREQIDGTTGD